LVLSLQEFWFVESLQLGFALCYRVKTPDFMKNLNEASDFAGMADLFVA